MQKPTPRRVAALAAAGLALAAGGGAAIAATSGDDRDAFLSDVATRLGVQETALEEAIEEASKARVDAAVEDGRLTEQRAEAIKERIEEGDGPIPGASGRGFGARGPGHRVHIDVQAVHQAAATHLEMTEPQLMTARRDGTSLADLAERQGTTVASLKEAMRAAAVTALARAVTDGDLADAERDRMVARLDERLDRMIEATPMRFRGARPGVGVPPGADERDAVSRAPGRAGVVL